MLPKGRKNQIFFEKQKFVSSRAWIQITNKTIIFVF